VYAKDKAGDLAMEAARVGANQIDLAAMQSNACAKPKIDIPQAKQAISAYMGRAGQWEADTVQIDNARGVVQVTVRGSWKPLFLRWFGVGDISVSGSGDVQVAGVMEAVALPGTGC
jgi:hypothetical protein